MFFHDGARGSLADFIFFSYTFSLTKYKATLKNYYKNQEELELYIQPILFELYLTLVVTLHLDSNGGLPGLLNGHKSPSETAYQVSSVFTEQNH